MRVNPHIGAAVHISSPCCFIIEFWLKVTVFKFSECPRTCPQMRHGALPMTGTGNVTAPAPSGAVFARHRSPLKQQPSKSSATTANKKSASCASISKGGVMVECTPVVTV